MRIPRGFFPSLLLAALTGLGGCSSVIQRTSDQFATNLGNAVLNSDDPATIHDGLPAYLLLLDSLIEGHHPDDKSDVSTLLAAAKLNAAYAGNFTGDDKVRAQRMAKKAFGYARRATCVQDSSLCAIIDKDVEGFAVAVNADRNVDVMYGLATAWAGYVQSNSEDWGAVADLPKIEVLLNRVVALDPDHDQGQVYEYLGVLNSVRPEAVGGKPELGRSYFEKAIALSGGRNLYAKTLEAQFYARLVFNQELHDKLLNDVLAADPNAPGMTLINTLAQERAKKLLASGKDYF
jgi:TRAP transporter T-component